MRPRHAAAALVLLIVAGAIGTGISSALIGGGERAARVSGRPDTLPGAPSGHRNRFSPAPAVSDGRRSLIAAALARRIAVRARPSASARARTLRARHFNGRRLPLVFL